MITETIQTALSDLLARMIDYLPNVLTAVVILVLGWLLARLLATLIRRLATRIGLDDVVKGSGLAEGMAQAKITRPASDLVALLIFWLVFLSFLLMSLENLGWAMAVIPLQSFIAYLPSLLAAILVLVGGAFLAQVVGQAVQAATASMGVEFHDGIGKAVRGLLLVATAIIAIEQIGFNVTLLTDTLTNLLTILAAGLALAFALGARDVARSVLAGYYARDVFSPGDKLLLDGETGVLEIIGALNAEITVPDGRLVIPNTRLTDNQVKIQTEQ